MTPVTIIGLGMSPKDLTETQLEMIRRADILMGGRRHLDYFHDLTMEKREVTKDIKGAIGFIRDRITVIFQMTVNGQKYRTRA